MLLGPQVGLFHLEAGHGLPLAVQLVHHPPYAPDEQVEQVAWREGGPSGIWHLTLQMMLHRRDPVFLRAASLYRALQKPESESETESEAPPKPTTSLA